MTRAANQNETFIAESAPTSGFKPANDRSFANDLCGLIGIDQPEGNRTGDTHNDFVFERRVFPKEADLGNFSQIAAKHFKRGTAKCGTSAWSNAMLEARGQAEHYAKALPFDHGWPPFMLVTDFSLCIDYHAEFGLWLVAGFTSPLRFQRMIWGKNGPDGEPIT